MDYQSLHVKTVADLRKLAKELKVRIPAGAKKQTIIEILLEADQGKGSVEAVAAPAPRKRGRRSRTDEAAKPEAGEQAGEQAKPAQPAEAVEAPKPEPPEAPKPEPQEAPVEAPKPESQDAPAEAPKPEPQEKPEEAPKPEPQETPVEAPKPETPEKPAETVRPEMPGKPAPAPSERPPFVRAGGEDRRIAPRPPFNNRVMRPASPDGRPQGTFHPIQPDGRPQGTFRTGMQEGRPQPGQPRPAPVSRMPLRPNTTPRNPQEGAAGESAPRPEFVETGSARGRREGYYNAEYKTSNPAVPEMLTSGECADGAGVLEIQPDGYGFLRAENCLPGPNDVYISIAQIRRFNLRVGDYVEGKTRPQREGDRYSAMLYINAVNGRPPEDTANRPRFEDLVPIYPDERLRLESDQTEGHGDLSLRLIDILAPIGKGQRGMIVSQPKAGKTTLLKKIANAITSKYPEIKLIVMLIDERPEEVTDMKRSIDGEVIYSTFDEAPENHVRVSEMVLERAQRLVEMGQDVVVLMDSITRLARAYNLVITPTGRSLSGGLDPGALFKPKRFFGAARNIENGGSLTVIATALVETGSRMDDIIFEEFKGTGNMELHLDRKLSDKRVFPAIDMVRSGTRREELLLTEAELDGEMLVRRVLSSSRGQDMAEQIISLISKTSNNMEFLEKMKGWLAVFEKEGFVLGGQEPNRGRG